MTIGDIRDIMMQADPWLKGDIYICEILYYALELEADCWLGKVVSRDTVFGRFEIRFVDLKILRLALSMSSTLRDIRVQKLTWHYVLHYRKDCRQDIRIAILVLVNGL